MVLDVPALVGNSWHMPRLTTVVDDSGTPPSLLTAPQVAEILQVSPEQVYRWCASKVLPSVKLGPQTLRIRPTDLEAFIGDRAA